MMMPLLAQLGVAQPIGRPRTRAEAVLADKARSSHAIRTHPRERGITTVMPRTVRPTGPPHTPRLTRRTLGHLQPRRLPRPQCHRAGVQQDQSLAWAGDQT